MTLSGIKLLSCISYGGADGGGGGTGGDDDDDK